MMSREEFQKLIKETREQFTFSWVSKEKNESFPLVNIHRTGRCRYCTKKTTNVLVDVSYNNPILITASNLMERSHNAYICDLNCFYLFLNDRQSEILEEITR